MCHHLLFCLVTLIALTINVQTVDASISGKVLNKEKKPIAKAILTLVGAGIKDTTGSDGAFSLATTDVKVPLTPKKNNIAFHKNFLDFSLSDPSPVKVEIFDINGALLKKEIFKNAQTGFYRFNIAEITSSAKLLLIRASIGQQKTVLRYVPLNNGKYTFSSSVEGSMPSGGKLAKITEVNDTLKVTAEGYLDKNVHIDSYDMVIDITLDSVSDGPVTLRLDKTFQTIDGFGINNTWASAMSDQDADQMFDSAKGLGLTILRIGMGSDGNPYNGNNCWNDIKKAMQRGCKYIIGTCWTPPARMKTNNSLNDGGHLKPEFYEEWANTVAGFAAKVKQGSGYNLYAMSPQNETDFASCGRNEPCNGNYETCLWTGKEYAAFFKIVAPKIRAANCKAMGPEASEWIHVWKDISAFGSEPGNKGSSDPLKCGYEEPAKCTPGDGYDYGHWLYKDTTAWNNLDILALHQYDTQVAEPWPNDVPRENKIGRIPIWQTEMSGVKWWPEQGPSSNIENGIAVAGWIHNALTVGEASAWCWWWWKPLETDDNEGLWLKNGSDTKRRHTFSNYSKFIRPGYVRVDMIGGIPAGVLISAYKGGNGTVVVLVAINKNSTSVTIPVNITGGNAPSSFTPYVTSANDNVKAMSAVQVNNGVLTVELTGKSVTTFVGK